MFLLSNYLTKRNQIKKRFFFKTVNIDQLVPEYF